MEEIGIVQPEGMTALNILTYVHGVGMSMRSSALPFLDPNIVNEHLHEHGYKVAQENTAGIWVFIGYWPKRNKTYNVVTSDIETAQTLINDPRMIRLMGHEEGAPVVPLGPSGNAALTVAEFNSYVNNDFKPVDSELFANIDRVGDDIISGFENILKGE